MQRHTRRLNVTEAVEPRGVIYFNLNCENDSQLRQEKQNG